MAKIPSSLLAMFALAGATACTQKNPAYCDSDDDCATGRCLTDIHWCEDLLPPDGGGCDGPCPQCNVADDCPLATPACANHACVACTRDEQCEARSDSYVGLCNVTQGTCVSDDEAIHVNNTGSPACNDAGPGTITVPYCTLQAAIDDHNNGVAFITVWPGGPAYAPFQVTQGEPYVAGRGDGNQVIVAAANGTTAILIDQATAHLRRLTARDGTDPDASGVYCRNSSTCYLARLTIHNNSFGVWSDGSVLYVDRSRIHDNLLTGGIYAASSEFHITNTWIWANGNGSASSFGGASLQDDGNNRSAFAFNTVLGNRSPTVSGVRCQNQMTLSSNIFRNNTPDDVDSTRCQVAYSAIADTSPWPNANNVVDDPLLADELPPVVDLHLQANSPCRNQGDPNLAIALDIDGQSRDSSPDMGADEIVP